MDATKLMKTGLLSLALCAGSVLAYETDSYIRLEYIDSTKGGGQYIDTGFLFRNGDVVELKFDLLSVDPADYNYNAGDEQFTTFGLFGVRESSSRAVALIQDVNTTPRQLAFDYGGTEIFTTRLKAGDLTVGSYDVACVLPQRQIVRPNGTSVSTSATSSAFTCGASAYLFAANLQNVSFTWLRHPQMRFRSLLIRRGTEDHLFLPVLRESDSKPGVYDFYNSKFLVNQGVGADFAAGPIAAPGRIEVVAGDGGRISVDGGPLTKDYSALRGGVSSVTLRAECDPGYMFDRWEVSGAVIADPTAETIVIPATPGDVTATAKFTRPVLVEYLESTKGGGQYIDTEFVMASGDFIELEFELLSVNPDDYNAVDSPPQVYSMFGARNETTGAIELCQNVNVVAPKKQQFFFDYDDKSRFADSRLESVNTMVGVWKVVSDGKRREIFRPDGTVVGLDIKSGAFSTGLSAYIFAAHLGGVLLDWLPHPRMRFRSLLIRRGTEEHLFCPARTSEGRPCVCDIWNNRLLKNRGGGSDFELGPDCASQGMEVSVVSSGNGVVCANGEICGTSFTTNLMFMNPLELSALPANGQAFLRWSCEDEEYDGNQLPAMRIVGNPLREPVSLTAEFGSDVPYSSLEYIDSTKGGGQYIDTEFLNQQGDVVDLRFDLLSTDPADYADDPDVFCVFGSRYKNNEAFLEVGHCLPKENVGIFLDYSGGQMTRLSSPSPVVGTYVVQGDGRNLQITNPNGQTVSSMIASPVAFTAGGTAYLFHSHLVEYTNAKWRTHPRMRFRSLSIRRGSEEHRFVPALRQSDSKPGVYDVFNSKFLENKGTGADFETKVTPFRVAVYGAGAVSINGGAPVTGLTRNLSLYSVDIMARPAVANASCVWVGLPEDCYRSKSGREVALMEANAPNVYLDVFTPSNADLVVPAGESEIVETLAGLKSVHVGTPVAGAEQASFMLLGRIDVSAANGGYAIVRTEGGKPKKTEIAILNGGKMKLLGDVVMQEVDLPDEKSVLDLNGHTLTIRSQTHRNRAGWAGKVIDSVGGGSVAWEKPGMAILLY